MIIANAETEAPRPEAIYLRLPIQQIEKQRLVCRPQFPHPLSLPTSLLSYPVILSPTPFPPHLM